MSLSHAVSKRFRSFFAARTRIVILCRFCAGCRRSKVFFVCDLFIERMRKFATRIGNGIFCVATVAVANCCFRSVLRAGGVIVGNVIRKTMPERITACKSFRSFFTARTRIVILCRFCAGCRRSKVFFVCDLFIERMRKFATRIGNGIFFIAAVTVANCRFRSVLRAGGVIVGNVICKTMSERITACKSFRAFFAAFARIIIGCRFGAGYVGRLIFVRYYLFVKRMNMLIFFTTG